VTFLLDLIVPPELELSRYFFKATDPGAPPVIFANVLQDAKHLNKSTRIRDVGSSKYRAKFRIGNIGLLTSSRN
jgi:hypothetical protein